MTKNDVRTTVGNKQISANSGTFEPTALEISCYSVCILCFSCYSLCILWFTVFLMMNSLSILCVFFVSIPGYPGKNAAQRIDKELTNN